MRWDVMDLLALRKNFQSGFAEFYSKKNVFLQIIVQTYIQGKHIYYEICSEEIIRADIIVAFLQRASLFRFFSANDAV